MKIPYDQAFYARQSGGSERSAHVVLAILFDTYKPASIVDFGCGIGTWLKAARDLGIRDIEGYEGSWVSSEQLLVPDIRFTNADIADRIVTKRFDLALCLEVAEHLPADKAPALIDNLCRAADVVLFSAAIPHQGGVGHVNERRQSYWAALFERQEFEPFDPIRPAIWNNPEVRLWYRQNILLFVKRGSTSIDRASLLAAQRPILDLVHPEMHEATARDARTSLRRLARRTRRSLFGARR